VRAAADSLRARLGVVEDSIYNPRLQSSQDPLNFPIRLNNKIAALAGVVESAEAAPTEQSYTVFDELSRHLDLQLAALDRLVKTDLPALNALLRARHLAEIRAEPQRPRPTADSVPRRNTGGDDEDSEDGDDEQRDW